MSDIIKNAETEVVETAAAEPKLPKFSDVINPAEEDRRMILVTAVRNKNTKLFWDYFDVPAGADVKQTIAGVTDQKLIILIDERYARKFIEEGKVLRGMASTVSDLTARYAKVMAVEVEDKAALTAQLIGEVLDQIDAGVFTGVWARPEVIEAEEAAEEEAEAAEDGEVDDPFEVEE